MKILVIEDDARTAAFIHRGLREQGHTVDICDNGVEGLHLATGAAPDAIIADRMVPGLDGLSLVKALRDRGLGVPVLMLTALGTVEDRVAGLEGGADDYLVKPFAFSELLARLNALLRRPALQSIETVFTIGDLVFDTTRRSVVRGDRVVVLTAQELKLLEFMVRRRGQIVTRSMLLENLWDVHFDPRTNIVDAHISRLRAKIDRGFDKDLILTVRGAGYMIDG